MATIARLLTNQRAWQELERQREALEMWERQREWLNWANEAVAARNAIAHHAESIASCTKILADYYKQVSASASLQHGIRRMFEYDPTLAASHLERYTQAMRSWQEQRSAWDAIGDDLRHAYELAAEENDPVASSALPSLDEQEESQER